MFKRKPKVTIKEEDNETFLSTLNPAELDYFPIEEIRHLHIRAKTTASQTFTQQYEEKKEEKTLEEMVPPEYHEFLNVFDKKAASRFPSSRPWDHKIELKEGFVPKHSKLYDISPKEKKELDKFIQENLEKGYI